MDQMDFIASEQKPKRPSHASRQSSLIGDIEADTPTIQEYFTGDKWIEGGTQEGQLSRPNCAEGKEYPLTPKILPDIFMNKHRGMFGGVDQSPLTAIPKVPAAISKKLQSQQVMPEIIGDHFAKSTRQPSRRRSIAFFQQSEDNLETICPGKDIYHEGIASIRTKFGHLKPVQVILSGNEVYFNLDRKGDSSSKTMHSLTLSFFSELPAVEDEASKKIFYPVLFGLPPQKKRTLFFESEEEQKVWLQRFNSAIDCVKLSDHYQVKGALGKGQFGMVGLGVHRKTGKKVAIKTVQKKNLRQVEVLQTHREMEVLKVSRHPNVIRMLEKYEDADAYSMVLELMDQDLFDYLKKRSFKLPETRVKELAFKIGQGIKYLHSFGIIHRDIKPDNIMMSDNTEQSIPKIVDFGLAKFIGPNETTSEPYGTFGYMAPEVIKEEAYSYSCDVWSYGVLIFALLCGVLPFDSSKKEEKVRKTLECDFAFPPWVKVNDEIKDLMTRMLTKDPAKRITLDAALAHPWFGRQDTL